MAFLQGIYAATQKRPATFFHRHHRYKDRSFTFITKARGRGDAEEAANMLAGSKSQQDEGRKVTRNRSGTL